MRAQSRIKGDSLTLVGNPFREEEPITVQVAVALYYPYLPVSGVSVDNLIIKELNQTVT